MSNLSYHQPRVPLAPSRLLLRTLSGHKSYVTSVSFFGPQCDRLITGSYDEVAKLWDLNTGRCLHKFSGHTDGITFVMPGPEGRILTASEDRTLRVWDADTGECVRVIRSHSGAVTGLCTAGPDRIVTCSADKKLRVFDITGHMCGEAELDSEIMAVSCAPLPAPTPPPSLLGAVSRADKVKRSSSSSIQPPAKASALSSSFSSFCSSSSPLTPAQPALTPAVVRVFACGGTHIPAPARPMLRRVDVETAKTTAAVAVNAGSLPESNLRTMAAVAAACDGRPDAEAGVVTCVAISAAGAKGRGVLVTGSYDKAVRVLRNVISPTPTSSSSFDSNDDDDNDDDDDGRVVRDTENAPPPPPSPSPRSSLPDGGAPPVSMRVLGRHEDGVRSVAVSADGRWAVSGGREGTIKVWELSEEEDALAAAATAAAEAAAAVSGKEVVEASRAKACFQAHRGVVFSLCMSPDSRVLVSAGSDNDVRVWDLSLVVYSRRMCLNRLRALWTAGRIRRARPKRNSGGSGGGGASSPKRTNGAGGGGRGEDASGSRGLAAAEAGELSALKAFVRSREQRQQILESLFALPDIIYAKIFMYV